MADVKELVFQALGEASAVFMKENPTMVMPSQELEAIGNKLIKQLDTE